MIPGLESVYHYPALWGDHLVSLLKTLVNHVIEPDNPYWCSLIKQQHAGRHTKTDTKSSAAATVAPGHFLCPASTDWQFIWHSTATEHSPFSFVGSFIKYWWARCIITCSLENVPSVLCMIFMAVWHHCVPCAGWTTPQ